MDTQAANCETRSGRYTIRAHRIEGSSPTVVFCGGFRSDMTGTKATALDAWCRDRGQGFVRFDYTGHGESDGEFEAATIGQWLQDTLAVIDDLTAEPLVLVGSSMGGWIMLLAAQQRPERIAGLVGIASAPDFTERLLWAGLDEGQQKALTETGRLSLRSDYLDNPTIVTTTLISEGRQHLLLNGPLDIPCPIRLLHSLDDPDVPWQLSLEIQQRVTHGDVQLTLLKDAGHRMSRSEDIALILDTTGQLLEHIN